MIKMLGDNPFSYGVVETIKGRHSKVEIYFDKADDGFHLYITDINGSYGRFYGKGSYVQIFKTLAGARRAAKKYLGD